MSDEIRGVLNSWLENRLASSTTSGINTVWNKHWVPFCATYGLDEYITSGHADRGGIMASFVVTLGIAGLVYATIVNYVWCVIDKHKMEGYASPLSNVRDWTFFMRSVQVETHMPSEPRLMVPWPVMTEVVKECNQQDMEEIAAVCILLILLFTGSRPEILPKSISLFADKHLKCGSIEMRDGPPEHLVILLEGTKADPLGKRPAARGNSGGSWRPIGGTASPLFSVILWMNKYTVFREQFRMEAMDPLFLDSNGKPLTYQKATAIFRRIQHRVDKSYNYAYGGVRSTFYVAVSTLFGSEHARTLGMWAGEACLQYDRPWLERTLSIPAKMAQLACSEDMPAGGLLEQLAQRMHVQGVNGKQRKATSNSISGDSVSGASVSGVSVSGASANVLAPALVAAKRVRGTKLALAGRSVSPPVKVKRRVSDHAGQSRVVESISANKFDDGRERFLVQWKGFDAADDTWESLTRVQRFDAYHTFRLAQKNVQEPGAPVKMPLPQVCGQGTTGCQGQPHARPAASQPCAALCILTRPVPITSWTLAAVGGPSE